MKKYLVIAGFLAAIFIAGMVRAATEEQAPVEGKAPARVLPVEATRLQAFTGHWAGTGRMKVPDQEGQTFSVAIDCAEAAAGWGILCQSMMTGVGIHYLGTDIIGYDLRTSRIRWYSITSAGEMVDYTGLWRDDKSFVVNFSGKVEGRSVSLDLSMALPSPSDLTVKSVATVEGREGQTMTVNLSKQNTEEPKPKTGE
ncbi:MAG: DUF1579 domain-containing protein [Alphaproteobacteria bacterium]|nr:MAG: DUF1579 domain-containing protein [Alphaproteobacteria bacterium]